MDKSIFYIRELINSFSNPSIRIKKERDFIFIFFLLSTITFFLPFPDSLGKAIIYLTFVLLLLIALIIPKKYRKLTSSREWVFYLFIFIVLFSIFPAYFYWEQSFISSFISVLPFFIYSLYIILIKLNIDKKFLQKCILIIGKIYIILIILKFIFPQLPIGGIIEDDNRGTRIMMAGDFFCYFLFFNKLKLIFKNPSNNKNKLWLILSLFAIILPLIRQRIFLALFLAIIYLRNNLKGKKKSYLLFILIGLFSIGIFSSSVNKIINSTYNQIESDNPHDQIRTLGYIHYILDFPHKGLNELIGNGVPSYGRSKYGNDSKNFAESSKIFLIDIGIVGIYNYFGIIGLFIYFGLFAVFIFKRCDQKYQENKYMLWFILGSSFLSGVPLIINQFIFIGLCGYLLTPYKKWK